MENENKKLTVVPRNGRISIAVGSAEAFTARLQQSVIGEFGIDSILNRANFGERDFVVRGEVKKNEFTLTLLADDASLPLSAPMIHGRLYRVDGSSDHVKINFQPNPRLNKVIFTAIRLSDLLFLVALVANLCGLGGINANWTCGVAFTLSAFARVTLEYMQANFPADPRLVAYVREIAGKTEEELESKKLLG